jgi:hypothetical protein
MSSGRLKKLAAGCIALAASWAVFGRFGGESAGDGSANGQAAEAASEPVSDEAIAAAGLARFLERAEPEQLERVGLTEAADEKATARYERILAYTQNQRNGSAIARMLAFAGAESGAGEEARRDLLQSPESSALDVAHVLKELPDWFESERVALLRFVAEAFPQVENRAQLQELFASEALRSGSPRSGTDPSPAPQAVALQAFFANEPDREKRAEALQAALAAQRDPWVREALQRLEPMARAKQRVPAAAAGD